MRRFRSNLQRMDRANSLELIVADLEALAAPARPDGSGRRPVEAREEAA